MVDPEKVIFKTSTGTEFQYDSYDKSSGRYRLTLVGGKSNDGQELYALYPKPGGGYSTLGKLTLLSYPAYRLDVKVVPVGSDLEEFGALRRRMQEIYARVGIDCRVEKMPVFDYDAPLIFKEKTGMFSAYNAEMKQLNRAYEEKYGIDEKASYLFILSKSGQGRDRDYSGFMPLNKQFGYLFRDDFKRFDDFAVAAAHELAHGRLSLRHPFDKSLGLAEGDLPGNLMDYRSGTHLAKWQWDLIHDPGVIIRIFERDQDAAVRSFKSFVAFKEVVTVYLNNLFNWGIKEGYELCMERTGRNLVNTKLIKYKPDQVSEENIKFIQKWNLMGMNEYGEKVEIEIPNYGKICMMIEFFLSDVENANQILKVEYIGSSVSMIHGEPGYFYLLKGLNNRNIGTINFSSKHYDIFSSFLKYYKKQGYDIGIEDILKDESFQIKELKNWFDQDKKYLNYHKIVPVEQVIIKRMITGDVFKLNCQ